MPLTKEQRITIRLLTVSGTTYFSRIFSATHIMQIAHSTVAKIIKKFKKASSVVDAIISGRTKTKTDEDTSTQVIVYTTKSPTEWTQHLSAQMGISQNIVMRILRVNKWQPQTHKTMITFLRIKETLV